MPLPWSEPLLDEYYQGKDLQAVFCWDDERNRIQMRSI